MMAPVTHLAYSDESQHYVGQFRELGLVSLLASLAKPLVMQLSEALRDTGACEFKGYKSG